jgi:TPR repeat protein
MYKRSILSSVIGLVIGAQGISNALADQTEYVLLAKADNAVPMHEVYAEKPKNQWGWWRKFQWESFFHAGITKKEQQMLKVAATYGDSQAQYVLAMFYSSSNNQEQTMYWLRKAAKQGHQNASFVYNYYINPPDNYGLGC